MDTLSFQFQTQFGGLESRFAGVEGLSEPSPQMPINSTPSSRHSQFSNFDGSKLKKVGNIISGDGKKMSS